MSASRSSLLKNARDRGPPAIQSESACAEDAGEAWDEPARDQRRAMCRTATGAATCSKEKATWRNLISSLKRQRDELALKIHLGKAEAKEEWDKVTRKLDELTRDYEPLKDAVGETAENLLAGLKLMTEEVQKGFNRIRKSLCDAGGIAPVPPPAVTLVTWVVRRDRVQGRDLLRQQIADLLGHVEAHAVRRHLVDADEPMIRVLRNTSM